MSILNSFNELNTSKVTYKKKKEQQQQNTWLREWLKLFSKCINFFVLNQISKSVKYLPIIIHNSIQSMGYC